MKRSTFLILLIPFFSSAQFRNNIWCFGDSAGIDFSNPHNPVPIVTSMDGRGSCVSVAESLLFYANTRSGMGNASTLVYDSQNQIMANGDLIRGEAWFNELVAIPRLNNTYFLFSINQVFSFTKGFYYSII